MHVLIVGGSGQLGRALQACLSRRHGTRLTVWTRRDQDITSPVVRDALCEVQPDVVINAAAWTDVDGAEDQQPLAFATNTLGPKYLAEGCAQSGADLVHISTNEVFQGTPGQFYYEYDLPNPSNTYARSKHGGEMAASRVMSRLYIVRVAWLFGPGGNHFPIKIAAAADRNGLLRVVGDEYGNPTYAPDVASAILALVETGRYGIYHLVNEGRASRYEFAQSVLAGTGREDVPITPILSSEWKRTASVPLHAVLCNQAGAAVGLCLRPWQTALAEYLTMEADRFARFR